MSIGQSGTSEGIICPNCGSVMVKKETYAGSSATEWELTVSSSISASGSFYQEKTVFKCSSCGKMLLV